MSQPFTNNPSINLSYVDEAGYQDRATQFSDNYFQQWGFPGARASINSVPSPTNTVQTVQTVRTAPPSRPAPRTNFQQHHKGFQYHSNIDPNLHNARFLVPPGSDSFPGFQNHVEPIADPIARFYQGDEPWNPMRYSNAGGSQNTFSQPQRNFRQYLQKSCSDVGSNAPVSDSGYHTQPTQSILSHDPGHVDQELPSELLIQTRTMNVQSARSESHEMLRMPSDQRSISQYSSQSANQRQPIPCTEPGCSVMSKCNSEHNKHMLKHNKTFICEEAGCKRGGKGFSTINDLDRHKKSVHHIGLANSKSYRCAAVGCQNKHKVWPRLDNFKQHIDRMHKNEDMFDLIKCSEFILQDPQDLPDPQTIVQPVAVVDSSHLLAGMGSETALTNGSDNDGAIPACIQNFVYPQFMSFSGRSNSSASQVSPTTQSSGMSFSQPGTSSFDHTGRNLLPDQGFSHRKDNTVEHQSGVLKASRVSSTGKVVKTTSARDSNSNVNSALQLQLSSEPQTKSEQQKKKLDLDKLSKTKLQEMLRQVLESQQQAGDDCIAHDIAPSVQEQIKSTRQRESSSAQRSASGAQQCPRENCRFSGRTCDLNKHLKRHIKPYGCTYPKCHKKFGAKSDWKRHENSQHFQQETYRCDLLQLGETCAQHFYRAVQFRNHLEHEHQVTSKEKMQEIIDRCKIGKNCQGQYWCGFCRAIKTLKTRRNYAWDERFDHIAHHFEKDIPKKNIDDWICVEENRTKKELLENMSLDEEEKTADAQDFDGDEMPDAHENHPSPVPFAPQVFAKDGLGKRGPQADFAQSQRPGKKSSPTILWICCQCHAGPETYSLQTKCTDIMCNGHAFCENCERFYAPEPDDEF